MKYRIVHVVTEYGQEYWQIQRRSFLRWKYYSTSYGNIKTFWEESAAIEEVAKLKKLGAPKITYINA